MARRNRAHATDYHLRPIETDELDYIERNRAAWDEWASGYVAAAAKAWQEQDLRWGLWGIPESELELLSGLEPDDDAIELGCGTAAVSAWLARRGVRSVALDISSRQLKTADDLQRRFGISFPLICGNAEDVMFEDASFDVAISEYGVSLWCDPRRWLPEAQRLLRPGAALIFFTNSSLLMTCTPPEGGLPGDRLARDYFGRYRVEFDKDGPVEFHLTHGDWVRLLREHRFVLEDLIEVRPPPGAKPQVGIVSSDWARRWPSEEIWIARKRSSASTADLHRGR
jgi:SAM-dependent methyltransferase